MCPKDADCMANNEDPDQTAPVGCVASPPRSVVTDG